MSLGQPIHQFLFEEQHLSEQSEKLKEVRTAITKCKTQLKVLTENYQMTTQELEMKDQQLSAVELQLNLMKKCKEQISKRTEELLGDKTDLQRQLAEMKTAFKDEEREFSREISSFNSEFSLCPGTCSPTHREVLNLITEADSLRKEMEEMIQDNLYMSGLLTQKKSLHLELQALKSIHADVQRQLNEAKETTAALQAESHAAHQKPFTDSDVIRLKKELEKYEDRDMELLLETLKMEVQYLQGKVDSLSGGEQH
ncbi:coiled-coil domain-containing protein 172 [Corythoichthys intestinalis]|uniref:coiled-coil domain-containing protein 172 n=1 Tax=Corythoichthys intestinalis TaxID=161448 RepID=UPI0025A5C4C9|nr:coiled-coil domain-containing protein 172 [Corythoichthys intestinalis]XP_057703815.1 coiled-coil domain-containing protein 172 [Corythoichthys intestinalis]XP_057703816.1 coiled-coil domain-containing protein 172 [Corythoichthys intestinalis]